ncbi:heterogeneous nuclear ribonucleoprotein 1-like [Salvia splendens]|uniref:heterogeneous nuclear ribonucleoprotein 1-like n=1 Tax=Salvia splendens TaxID=180675 RepID=UPI001C27341E|nr:heterogeneous nuclear ribonucleoprotein 1-like [Salvia splendens]XP_042003524.1 heterogeneous nuclear ribonucleoprotein 1-like [Salvia splendens]XP_042003525.1 heterogeneous nuclear ribonucleoprotein 1-like [Salvia splendens]XP_042003526.1 heterogeneous nuclear ribonucleoprotein 1-like [Salvia splendens]XP_042003527.1 heterogeneous nuclear ribonucleoprotein 1-like [Salvia splendens]
MEVDQGKLFIGGISWDTNEDCLKEYFETYGDVAEAVIMRDRTTGRARGFGFVVYADPTVAERVVKEKHMIDGRTVEAKKAIPRDDQNLINRNSGSMEGSPGPGRTKKIFVGGLASTVTENDFKTYFDQFGTITDVVVMYDHNTQRQRGFGFITYDSEEAVDMVLHKTFHELNGKMVEIKRAVPKELSPGPSRSPPVGYNYGFTRPSSFMNNYAQGYNLSPVGGYGVRMDGRYSPLASARAGFSHFGSPAYGLGVNMVQRLGGGFGGGSNFNSNLGYGRVLNPYFASNQSRYNTPIGFNTSNSRGESFLNSSPRSVWGNDGLNASPNSAASASYFGSGSGGFGVFGNNGTNWGTSPVTGSLGGGSSGYNGGNFVYRGGDNNYSVGAGGFGRNTGTGVATTSSFPASTGDYEGSYGDFYRSGSVYSDPTWQTASSELDNSNSFGYGLGNPEDVAAKDSEDYVVGYDLPTRQSSRGIAA